MNKNPAISSEGALGNRIKGAEMLSFMPSPREGWRIVFRARKPRHDVRFLNPCRRFLGKQRSRPSVGRQHTDSTTRCDQKRQPPYSTFVLSPARLENEARLQRFRAKWKPVRGKK